MSTVDGFSKGPNAEFDFWTEAYTISNTAGSDNATFTIENG